MSEDEIKREAWKAHWREQPPDQKVNWHWYICRGCNRNGDSHMVSLQARLELCDVCYGELPMEWKQKRGGRV